MTLYLFGRSRSQDSAATMFCGEQQLDSYEFLDYSTPEMPTSSLHFSYSTPRDLDSALYGTTDSEAEQWSPLDSQLLSSDLDPNLSLLYPENESASPVSSEPGQNHSDNYHLFYSPLPSGAKLPTFVTPQEPEPEKQCVNMSDITSSTPSFSDDPFEIKEETPRRPSSRKRGRPPRASYIQNQVPDEDQTPTGSHKRPRLFRNTPSSDGRNSTSRTRNKKVPAVSQAPDYASEDDDYISSDSSLADPSAQYDSDSSYEDESRSARKAVSRRRSGYKKHLSAAQALRDLERQRVESQHAEPASSFLDSLSATSSPLSFDTSLPVGESALDEGLFELNLVSEQNVIDDHLGLDMNCFSTDPLGYSSSDHSSRADDNEASRVRRPVRRSMLPQPVPVPNLTKKSRGRKVPVDARAKQLSPHASRLTLDNPDPETPGSYSSQSKAKVIYGGIQKASGERRFVCTAEGCGKCFVRGEHLKRHVKSLHTYDKRKQPSLP